MDTQASGMFHNNSQIRVCFYILTYYERISFQRTMSRLSDDFYPLCPHAKSIFAYGFDWIYVHCAYVVHFCLLIYYYQFTHYEMPYHYTHLICHTKRIVIRTYILLFTDPIGCILA